MWEPTAGQPPGVIVGWGVETDGPTSAARGKVDYAEPWGPPKDFGFYSEPDGSFWGCWAEECHDLASIVNGPANLSANVSDRALRGEHEPSRVSGEGEGGHQSGHLQDCHGDTGLTGVLLRRPVGTSSSHKGQPAFACVLPFAYC